MEKVTVYTFNIKAQVGFETENGTQISITEYEALQLRDLLIKELVQTGK